ncbi:Z-ring formation inhibitor MciZ [Paenibacillus macerans]|uniref:Z-ring formation inhibitor MciZ n=1 Tax=Paenibacillus macerans TaxID=44252 RepID=UPI003D30F570
MKSYFAPSCVRAQGKAWQIRILLSQWIKEAGSHAKIAEFIESRRSELPAAESRILSR